MKKISLILTLALCLTLTSAQNYTYYVFATEWIGTVCLDNNCTAAFDAGVDTEFFNIHGLWPSGPGSSDPENCPGPTFNPANISSNTAASMISEWSGLYSSALSFHQHEWSKHGTCWNDPNPSGNVINDFFTQVISVANQFNVYSVLKAGGITPSSTNTYTLQQLTQVLSQAYNVQDFEVWCDTSSQLSEFYFCLDLNYNAINCPNSGKTSAPRGNLTAQNLCTNGTNILYPVPQISNKEREESFLTNQ